MSDLQLALIFGGCITFGSVLLFPKFFVRLFIGIVILLLVVLLFAVILILSSDVPIPEWIAQMVADVFQLKSVEQGFWFIEGLFGIAKDFISSFF